VPYLGDGCAVAATVESRLAVAHADAAREAELRALALHPALAADGPPGPRDVPGEPALLVLSQPLVTRRDLGTVHFFRPRERPFTQRDRRVAAEFAARAAQAIENALLYGEAREAIRAREEFISVASHELRTPLTPLAIQASAMHRIVSGELPEGPLRAGLLSRVAVCTRQVDRITRLVTNLLDVSRLRANRLDLQLESFDLRDLVLEVATRFQEELAPKRRALEVDAPEPLPGCWDRTRLEQVVANLLSNAVRYGDTGPIRVTATASPRGVSVAVRDHGRGIPPEEVGRLFERFERATNSSANGGLGLGLYIVRRVVEAHGGTIRVDTALGEGATFTVELPREAPGDPADAPARA
jgi:signal transduction histidine kinase